MSRATRLPERYPFRIGMLLGAVLTVAVVLLIVQNGESARIDWLTLHFRAKLWLLLFITFVAGAIVWEAAKAALKHHRRRARKREHGTRSAPPARSPNLQRHAPVREPPARGP